MTEPAITCPKCGTTIKLTETLAAPLIAAERAKIEADSRQRAEAIEKREQAVAAEKRQLAEREAAVQRSSEELEKRIAERLNREREGIRAEAGKKAAEAVAIQLKAAQDAAADKDAKLVEAQQKELELLKRQRALEEEKRENDLKVARRIDEERQHIREATRKEDDEQYRLKIAEYEKRNQAMQQQIDELRRKSEQGSQQLQGEVQELELEALLRAKFPSDLIEPVGKGERGGDVSQRVIGPAGKLCGTIVWESKRTKAWSDQWLGKLRDDMRAARADLAVIVSVVRPKNLEHFDCIDGVWVTSPACALPVAAALRQTLIETAAARQAMEGRQGKMDLMYGYLTGAQFRQHVSAMAEAYQGLREELDKERRALQSIWAKREKQLDRMLGGVAGMYGDLQGIMGRSLPEVSELELPVPLQDSAGAPDISDPARS